MLISQFMESLGNDFIIIDGVTQNFEDSKENISTITNQKYDLSFDQLMMILPPQDNDSDLRLKIFNIDGSESENCVNGIRCVARYVFDEKLVSSDQVIFSINNELINVSKKDGNLLEVQMSNLSFESADIGLQENAPNFYEFNDSKLIFSSVSVGNPHAVILNDDVNLNIPEAGKAIQESGYFMNGVNVGFMEIISPSEINLRVVERGVGETQACGSGACAASAVGAKEGKLSNKVKVNFYQGSVEVITDLSANKVNLIGDSNYRARNIPIEL